MSQGREFEFRTDWRDLRKAIDRDAGLSCPDCDGQACHRCIRATEALERLVNRFARGKSVQR